MPNKSTLFPILVVDDDPEIVDIISRAARNCFPEADIASVATFLEAVRYVEGLEGKGPRLILLDVDLQGDMDGFAFLALLRSHAKGRLIPTVVLSGSEDINQINRAYELGATAYMAKPFSFSDWKEYLQSIKAYWFDTVTLPHVYFNKDSQATLALRN